MSIVLLNIPKAHFDFPRKLNHIDISIASRYKGSIEPTLYRADIESLKSENDDNGDFTNKIVTFKANQKQYVAWAATQVNGKYFALYCPPGEVDLTGSNPKAQPPIKTHVDLESLVANMPNHK